MYKQIKLILLLSILAFSVHAQNFFKPLEKPTVHHSVIPQAVAAPQVQNAFRPVANIASYAIPDNALMTGAGISYQHLQWNAESEKWTSVWSINALAWYKSSLAGDPNAFAYGVAGGVFNNIIMLGAATDGHKVFATVGIGINLNN